MSGLQIPHHVQTRNGATGPRCPVGCLVQGGQVFQFHHVRFRTDDAVHGRYHDIVITLLYFGCGRGYSGIEGCEMCYGRSLACGLLYSVQNETLFFGFSFKIYICSADLLFRYIFRS